LDEFGADFGGWRKEETALRKNSRLAVSEPTYPVNPRAAKGEWGTGTSAQEGYGPQTAELKRTSAPSLKFQQKTEKQAPLDLDKIFATQGGDRKRPS